VKAVILDSNLVANPIQFLQPFNKPRRSLKRPNFGDEHKTLPISE